MKTEIVICKTLDFDEIEKVWQDFEHRDFWATYSYIKENKLEYLFTEDERDFMKNNYFDYVVFSVDWS